MTELSEIAEKYGTDKCPAIKHHFTEKYFEMFDDDRFQIFKMLEIGIGDLGKEPTKIGASLYMWRDFFPNALIYGADIVPELLIREPRIITYQVDQRSEVDLNDLVCTIGSDVEIVIEDGLHTPESQVFTCRTLMPLLDNPIYIIEDAGNAGYIVKNLSDYRAEIWNPGKGRKYRDDQLVIVRKNVES